MYGCLDPLRQRNRPNMAAFADEINNGPMLLALLQMRELQISKFAASQSATKQHGENGAIALPFERVSAGGDCKNRRASSAVSQFPSRTPSFLTPFTRRTPAASSGLSRPASAASYAKRRTAASRPLIVPADRFRFSRKIR